jgi:neutral trehalase
LKKVKAVSSFLPLFAGICDRAQAAALARHLSDPHSFATPLSIPTVAVDDPVHSDDMWRGPVWINYNYMVICGLSEYGYKDLADEIKRKTIEAVDFWYAHDGVIYEFYDSENRVSPSRLSRKGASVQPHDLRMRIQSIRDYGWSSAVFVALVMEDKCA